MIEKPLGIIPARGGSKRFPGKNIAELNGKPLLGYAIESAVDSGVFSDVIVTSDDGDILDVARSYDSVEAVKRPEEFATDTAQYKDACLYHLEDFRTRGRDYKTFGVVLVTNPLRRAEHIREAYEVFENRDGVAVMSLVPRSHPPQRALSIENNFVKPFFGEEFMKRTQELEPTYKHDGSILFMETEVFLEKEKLFVEQVEPYFMPEEESVDIDEPIHLEWAEFLLNKRDN
ncbi:MAG: cytidylyltransferase domain-containing protein [bacterium]